MLQITQNTTPAALRPSDVAALTSLSIQHLARLRRDGKGPAGWRKVGHRTVIYSREGVETWLNGGGE